jgi:hypothetical protein
LRDLDIKELRSHWHTVLGRPPPSHLPRHLQFRVVAYRLQADRYGDLDDENKRLLDHSKTPAEAVRRALVSTRRRTEVRPGTVFSREWSGQIHQVTVLAHGFAWNGKIYSQPLEGRVRHHRQSLEWTAILWTARQAIEGSRVMI